MEAWQPPFDRDDAEAILAGLFDVNARLVEINVHLAAMRILLGDEDEEEEEGHEGAD